MKRWKRRLTAWLLVLLLALGLGPQEGRAVLSEVYFTAVNEQLLDLNSETMPFYSNGVLYVSSRVFEGGELGLSYGRNTTLGLATLYRQGSNMDLRFDIAGQVVYDKQYNMYNGSNDFSISFHTIHSDCPPLVVEYPFLLADHLEYRNDHGDDKQENYDS